MWRPLLWVPITILDQKRKVLLPELKIPFADAALFYVEWDILFLSCRLKLSCTSLFMFWREFQTCFRHDSKTDYWNNIMREFLDTTQRIIDILSKSLFSYEVFYDYFSILISKQSKIIFPQKYLDVYLSIPSGLPVSWKGQSQNFAYPVAL